MTQDKSRADEETERSERQARFGSDILCSEMSVVELVGLKTMSGQNGGGGVGGTVPSVSISPSYPL